MACYIITYDLLKKKDENRSDDYKKLADEIKAYKTWAKITESCWAIVSEDSTTSVRDRIKLLLKKGDRLFVAKSSGIAAWSNVICSSEWLKERL